MLKVGTILRGTYRIDSYLSSGGFGNTYVATNIEFDERVAIKEFFMKGVTQRDENQTTVSVSNAENHNIFLEQKEKFKKEARRIRQLKNEHIVAVHDLFEENGTAYYVMDYVDGENLAERLKRTGKPMSEQEVRDILPQILDALKSVHDAGIWHLDLKPANIMIDKAGKVKLIDFGASKQLNAQKGGATTSTAISYTNGYAPREQMEQNYDKFGPWTDIYALGATLYNLLSNIRPPLPTDIEDDISEDKHLALPFPAGVSKDMKMLILQLMRTNRNQRPRNINEINESIFHQGHKVDSFADEETIIATCNNPYKKTNNTDKIISTSNKTEDVERSSSLKSSKINKTLLFILISGSILIVILSIPHNTNNNKKPSDSISQVNSEVVDSVVDSTISCSDDPLFFKVQDKKNGYFRETYINGSKYEGDFKDGMRRGRGIMTWKDGAKYDGDWEDGMRHGKGIMTWKTGEKYEGEFKKDERTGYGTYTWPETEKGYLFKYVGYFKNGEMEGKGTGYYVGGEIETGIWKNGEFVGEIVSHQDDKVYNLHEVNKYPQLQNGMSLSSFFSNYTFYPKNTNAQQDVVLTVDFIVEQDGTISNIKAELENKNNDIKFHNEVVRTINSMPNWDPGIYKGNIVRTKISGRITFWTSQKRVSWMQ